jgi:PTS system nitrogen regulatory IIA component
MFPANFLTLERIDCHNKAASKKRALEEMGRLLASIMPDLSQDKVFDHLLERERLGSTGLGHGVALHNSRIKGLTQACGALILLENSIDYDAIDGKPVDLIFGLLVPHEATQEHLQLLATLASLFSNEEFRMLLRQAGNKNEVMALMQNESRFRESA